LPEDYYKAAEMARAQAKANAFRDGIPHIGDVPGRPSDPNAPPDYSAMSQKMLQLGDYPTAASLQSTSIEMQRMRNGQRIADQYFAPAGGGSAPSAVAPPSSVASGNPRAPPLPAKLPAIREVLMAQGIPNNRWDAAAGWLSRQLGVPDNAQIDTKDPRISNVLGPAIGFLKKNGIGQIVQDGPAPATAPPPQATPTF
jgi:hypothetical protein